MKNKYYSQKEKKELLKKAGVFIFVLALVFIAAGVASRVVDQKRISNTAEISEEEKTDMVDIHGVKCIPKKNIRTYLFMGTDTRGEAKSSSEYDGTGQCDVLELLVIDKTTGTYTRLPINRDTMTDVKSLEQDGTYLATSKVQIALAHSSGDGMEISCENTVDAVSNLLYGQKVDGYLSLNMDSIKILNHLAGGVTVTIEDDFSQSDSSLKRGSTLTLTDEQAMHYVHDRMNVGDGTNEGRMKRQSVYLEGLKSALVKKCRKNSEFALDIYDALDLYMVTDITRNDFINLAGLLLDSEEQETMHIEGENVIGEMEFNEFNVNEDSLAETVIQLFYDKVEK